MINTNHLVHEIRHQICREKDYDYAHPLEVLCPKCSADWGQPCGYFGGPAPDQNPLINLLNEARIAKEIYLARFEKYDNQTDLDTMYHWVFVMDVLEEKLGNKDGHAY